MAAFKTLPLAQIPVDHQYQTLISILLFLLDQLAIFIYFVSLVTSLFSHIAHLLISCELSFLIFKY